MAADRPEPLIFNAWLRLFHAAVLRRAGITDSAASPTMEFTAWVLGPDGAAWCGGDCKPLLSDALKDAVGQLQARYGIAPAKWRWGEAHPAVFANPLLRALPVIGPLTTARHRQPRRRQHHRPRRSGGQRGGVPLGAWRVVPGARTTSQTSPTAAS